MAFYQMKYIIFTLLFSSFGSATSAMLDRSELFSLEVPVSFSCPPKSEGIHCLGRIGQANCAVSAGVADLTPKKTYSLKEERLILKIIGLNEYEKFMKKPHVLQVKINGDKLVKKDLYFESVEIDGAKGIAQAFVYDILSQTTLRRHWQSLKIIRGGKRFDVVLECDGLSYKGNAKIFDSIITSITLAKLDGSLRFKALKQEKKAEPGALSGLLKDLDKL